ncbi:MAG: flagellar biosynthetic protein FliO [Verrucomicrobiales bacterium]|nr:flagellar biosynthetic protein FliO [Verrucomicrobiales bacterium]
MRTVPHPSGSAADEPATAVMPTGGKRYQALLRLAVRGIAALAVLILTTAAVGGPATNGPAPASLPIAPLPDVGGSVIRVVGALAFVLALLFGGLWLVRHWRRFLPGPVRTPELRVLECRALGGRQAVWLVGYRRQRLLLGSTQQGVSLLAQLPDAETDEVAMDATPDFAIAFQHLLQRKP